MIEKLTHIEIYATKEPLRALDRVEFSEINNVIDKLNEIIEELNRHDKVLDEVISKIEPDIK